MLDVIFFSSIIYKYNERLEFLHSDLQHLHLYGSYIWVGSTLVSQLIGVRYALDVHLRQSDLRVYTNEQLFFFVRSTNGDCIFTRGIYLHLYSFNFSSSPFYCLQCVCFGTCVSILNNNNNRDKYLYVRARELKRIEWKNACKLNTHARYIVHTAHAHRTLTKTA